MAVRFATIDVGTNTVGTQLAEIRGPDDFELVDAWGDATRLGEGVERTGALDQAAMERTLTELRRSGDRLAEANAAEVVVVGTSALRDAANCADFVRRVAAETGWTLRVLSAGEEAAYSYSSVRTALGLGAESVLVADLGGGSLELIWGLGAEVVEWITVPLGSVRLTERLVHSEPVSDPEFSVLADTIYAELAQIRPPFMADRLFGMAGTFLTLVTVEHGLPPYSSERHGHSIALTAVQRQVQDYRQLPVARRRAIPGMELSRADIILAGAMIVEGVMRRFAFDRAQVSGYGLGYGIVAERAAQMAG